MSSYRIGPRGMPYRAEAERRGQPARLLDTDVIEAVLADALTPSNRSARLDLVGHRAPPLEPKAIALTGSAIVRAPNRHRDGGTR